MTTRRPSNSNIMINMARLVSFVGILSPFFSATVKASFTSKSNAICEPGFYAFTENGSDCQACPSGTYSDVPGAEYCKQCLDTIYSGEGANSAELWNGDLYCVYLGSTDDDDFLNSNSGDTAEPTVSISPSSIQTSVEFPSTVPSLGQSSGPSEAPSSITTPTESVSLSSLMQSSGPSEAPSTMLSKPDKSLMPTSFSSSIDHGDVRIGQFQSLAFCNRQSNETDYFEWRGRCKECPAKYEMILYPTLVLLVLVTLIAFLEFLLPLSYITHVWCGVEYLQMLYLIGFASVSWSPAAGFLMGKVLPIFALDFNASFSLQCIMRENWPQQEAADQLLVLSLPIIFLILLTFLSKISKRFLRDESVSRWMAVLLNLGYLKLVLSSLEAIQLPTSWSADDLSAWTNSDPFYSTLGGLAGLLFYGLAFPLWFLQSIRRYTILTQALAEVGVPPISYAGQNKESGEGQPRDPRNTKYIKRRNELYLTLGIFPINLRQNAWWWPGIWMLRKLLFAVVWYSFRDGQFLFLMVFLLVNLLSVIVQQYFQPFGDDHVEASAGSNKKWHSISAVDSVLQICLAALLGIAFLSSWPVNVYGSARSIFHNRMEDSLVLLIFFASLVFLTVTIVICCLRPEPRFRTVASQIMVNNNKKNDNDTTSTSTEENSALTVPSVEVSTSLTSSMVSSYDVRKEIEFFAAGRDSAWDRHGENANSVDEEYDVESEPRNVGYGSGNSPPFLVGEDGEQSSRKHNEEGLGSCSSRSRLESFLCDSTVTTDEDDYEGGVEDDTKTVYEEVWVDDETGEEITDPEQGNWMDAETGLILALENTSTNDIEG